MRGQFNVNGKEYDNMSLDKSVGFLEEDHKYILLDDEDFNFTSVTTILKQYEAEEFIKEEKAVECNDNPNSEYYQMGVDNILQKWDWASTIGTMLHDYGEKLLNGVEVPEADIPPDERAKYVPVLVNDIKSKGYEIATTELLVYSLDLQIAGQSDIILKKKIGDEYKFMIYDFKFLKDPIKKKSYFNPVKRRFKKMTGPFRFLDDCNWIHYSIQLSIYQTLTGDPGKIIEKVLVVVTTDGYEFVPCYPMRVFWDHNDELQAIYEIWDGRWYDSRTDCLYSTKPTDIVGL
jgi:hypothetical protein